VTVKSLDLFRLDGKVAIVTGGARGLGRQHALALAEAGAKLAICDLLEEEGERTRAELAAICGDALFGRVDVGSSIQIEAFLETVQSRFGRLDILVNNAGRPSEGIELDLVGDELWRNIIDINLSSLFYFGKRAAAIMRESGGGSIINIGSINSTIISNITPRHNVTYCVAKAGVAHLSRGMAAEWASWNVRVNTLAPGYILTDQTAASASNPSIYERNIANTPMGRYGRIDELKGAVVFLASDASSFMTGGLLTIDGGYTIW
jgi:NAD(P)-dependent dehydrogenase (short-subunit alcohol dehydrogenase family)